MGRIEAAMRRWRWVLVLAYFGATSVGHLAFTRWLLQPRESAWLGHYAFKDAVPALLIAGAGGLLVWVLMALRRDPRGLITIGPYWLAWMACVVVVDRTLTYSIYEYAHYPQYGLMAWWMGRALDPSRSGGFGGRILFWTTLLGVADECLQYLWTTATYSNYLDFNDFAVNLLGAAAGMMLYENTAGRARARLGGAEWRAACLLVLLLAGILAAGRLQISPPPGITVPPGGRFMDSRGRWCISLQRDPNWYGHWQNSPHRGAYWALSPGGGLVVLVLVGTFFAGFPRSVLQQFRA